MTSPTRLTLGIALAGTCCAAIGLGVALWNTSTPSSGKTSRGPTAAREISKSAARLGQESFPDPDAPGTSARVFIDRGTFDQEVFDAALSFTGPIRDAGSLEEVREAVRGRGRRGIAALRDQYDRLRLDSTATVQQQREAIRLEKSIASLYMHEGKFAEAASWLGRILEPGREEVSADLRAEVHVLLGIAALRRGEVENCLDCVGPSSCIFPIAREAFHVQQAGSREAIEQFTAYLKHAPGDLRVRWLLNLACMTLGEYPEKVPPAYLIPLDGFRSKLAMPRFENVAKQAGLGARGPNLAGGSIFDDFNGDDRPDLLATSIDADLGASLFINQGDGTFADRSAAAGLSQQVYALNVVRADYDNDGKPDVLLLRAPGRTRPGSRSCGTKGTASSRT